MKTAVIVFPGSNCDRDMQVALHQATGHPPVMVWHKDTDFDAVDVITLPGGFSYGDYLRCGAMAAQSPIMREVVRRAKRGVPVLGVCNGFQILCESGLLPGALLRNRDLNFVCRDVHLRVVRNDTVFTRRYDTDQIIRIPVAHHDGNYFIDDDRLRALEDNNQIALRYCDAQGRMTETANPNGSRHHIAGLYNDTGTVLGMMPHPERLCDPQQGGTDGANLFASLLS